ncbi:MAG: ATP-dependent protease ATPase subunit HslU [Succinivibrionaceae bacterium]
MKELTPKEIVNELNKHIVGQFEAKKSVAIAIRNRWRRMQLDKSYRSEVTPKNILMIGPTGVGKTEISRRLAKLINAPFIKVEATKFTEIGYVGKEVDSIIRDLSSVAMKMLKDKYVDNNLSKATDIAINEIIDEMIHQKICSIDPNDITEYNNLKEQIIKGNYDSVQINVSIPQKSFPRVEIMTPSGMEDMASQLEDLFGKMEKKTQKKDISMSIKEAIQQKRDQIAINLIDEDELNSNIIEFVENNGIVFIDEIDKICESNSMDKKVSREGVQRDLLPLIEGCSVKTKYGFIKTDHILFIASGAFQFSKPSDLIPELQGRLPIRVELKPLTTSDFEKILTETHASLTEQSTKLLSVDGIKLTFTDDGIKQIAKSAFEVNTNVEDIGARRLHTIMEKILEDIAFEAPDCKNKEFIIDENYVKNHLDNIICDTDISRYIL